MDAREAAAVLGRLGGLAKSAKKIAASVENGKKGGRPPKAKPPSTPPASETLHDDLDALRREIALHSKSGAK